MGGGIYRGWPDEKQTESRSLVYPLRTRCKPATAPTWALSWGIEMAKTETENLVVVGCGVGVRRVVYITAKARNKIGVDRIMV